MRARPAKWHPGRSGAYGAEAGSLMPWDGRQEPKPATTPQRRLRKHRAGLDRVGHLQQVRPPRPSAGRANDPQAGQLCPGGVRDERPTMPRMRCVERDGDHVAAV